MTDHIFWHWRIEHITAADEYVNTSCYEPWCRLALNATIHLNQRLATTLLDETAQTLHLLNSILDEFLSAESWIDAHQQHHFDITDDIFQTETEILKGIAADGSCVIAGRSGFHIFRDHPNHLSILIQASMDYRVSRLMKKQSISAEEARKIIDEVDKGRENYVKKYTGSSRYDTRNYQLVINVDGHSEDEIVEMILMYLGTSGNKIIF